MPLSQRLLQVWRKYRMRPEEARMYASARSALAFDGCDRLIYPQANLHVNWTHFSNPVQSGLSLSDLPPSVSALWSSFALASAVPVLFLEQAAGLAPARSAPLTNSDCSRIGSCNPRSEQLWL